MPREQDSPPVSIISPAVRTKPDTYIYELVFLLDVNREQPERTRIVADTERLIKENGGDLRGSQSWGTRQLAYEIDKHNEAEYYMIRFEGSNDVLASLHHNLKISEIVIRFRIIKVDSQRSLNTPTEPGEFLEEEHTTSE